MELRTLIWKVLTEQLDIQITNLKNKYVGEGKPISEEDFNKILEVSLNKNYLMSWLTKKVGSGIIKSEDIYKWKEYFEIFEKNKNKFDKKDIHLYKTSDDVKDFILKVIEIRESSIKFEEVNDTSKYVSKNDIEKLEESGGVKYHGLWEGYQVFQIWDSSENTWKLYRDILGRCRGRGRGAKIEICTIGDYYYFKKYLNQRGLSDYFVLFNLEDKKSPYQVHYSSKQFMNKDDQSEFPFSPIKFFKWIETKVPEYKSKYTTKFTDLEHPYKNEGFIDDNHRKQGKFVKYYSDGTKNEINTYKNDKKDGLFIIFGVRGSIKEKGHYKNNVLHGLYMGSSNRVFKEKGNFSKGKRVGIWQFWPKYGNYKSFINSDVDSIIVDFETNFLSGMSGNHLYFVSKNGSKEQAPKSVGSCIFFYPDGSTKAIGKLTSTSSPTDKWTFFDKNGNIICEGNYNPNKGREGEWTDVIKFRGKKYIIVSDFLNYRNCDVKKIYDKEGFKIDKKNFELISKYFENADKIDRKLFENYYENFF